MIDPEPPACPCTPLFAIITAGGTVYLNHKGYGQICKGPYRKWYVHRALMQHLIDTNTIAPGYVMRKIKKAWLAGRLTVHHMVNGEDCPFGMCLMPIALNPSPWQIQPRDGEGKFIRGLRVVGDGKGQWRRPGRCYVERVEELMKGMNGASVL